MSTTTDNEENSMNQWNLSEDDDYEDIETSEDEEVDHKLEERVDDLISQIKPLLRSDSYAVRLELKEVPHYVTKKSIEDFFSIRGSRKAEVDDPSPGTKRDVIVYFYDVDLFCEALKKNGRLIQSYTFDVVYNPNLHRSRNRVPPRQRHDHHDHHDDHGYSRRRGGHGSDNYHPSGDVRNLDYRHQGGNNQHDYQRRNNHDNRGNNGYNRGRDNGQTFRRNRYEIDGEDNDFIVC